MPEDFNESDLTEEELEVWRALGEIEAETARKATAGVPSPNAARQRDLRA